MRISIMSKTDKDIIICGGGIAGLTAALLLADQGVRVACIDQRPFDTTGTLMLDARTTALLQGSLNILRATGAWDLCKDAAEPLWTMRIVDDSGANKFSPVVTDFDAHDMPQHGEDGPLPFGENVPNEPLRRALITRAREHGNIDLRAPHSVTGISYDGPAAHVTLDNGDILSAPLIIGADGRNSLCREAAGIDVHRWEYPQSAIVCVVEHDKPHNNISTEFHRPTGPFTVVPFPGNYSSIVWSEDTGKVDYYLGLDEDDFNAALNERSAGRYGTMKLVGDRRAYPLSGLHARKYTAPRLALVAEAAHVLHPIGAQGLNLSLRDVATLCEIVVDGLRCGMDIGKESVLHEYERRRRPDIQSRVTAIDGFNRIVSNNAELLRTARRLGLTAIDKIPVLKSFVMRQGMDPAMDSSRLLRGEAL